MLVEILEKGRFPSKSRIASERDVGQLVKTVDGRGYLGWLSGKWKKRRRILPYPTVEGRRGLRASSEVWLSDIVALTETDSCPSE